MVFSPVHVQHGAAQPAAEIMAKTDGKDLKEWLDTLQPAGIAITSQPHGNSLSGQTHNSEVSQLWISASDADTNAAMLTERF